MTDAIIDLSSLDDIERRAEAATPRPWQAFVAGRDHLGGDDFIRTGGLDAAYPDMYVTLGIDSGTEPAGAADLDFIAHARQDIPALAGMLRDLVSASARDHSDYSHDYPTCARTHATLRVFSEQLEPEAITTLLAAQPTRSHRVGDPVSADGRAKREAHGWLLNTEGRVTSQDVRRHIDWLLDAVDREELSNLIRERRVDANVFCYWESKSGHGGPQLSPSQMIKLARRGLSVGFDVYHP